ncbi:double-strand break repair protein AddB [Shimia thalassica]|uniref:double-strand break repair protein AddB n=1 Tax=Shimia thalassica TaxID=1715693 RepID=UPI001C09B6A8|nr:double-strand break repair protein AddB [Shimia thalassica]MBU2945058.1 double-strand break repair protein AddB [Shimia thalassica]MDO6504634.1 double-strand break repair protein AddB [Shimia thalassica]
MFNPSEQPRVFAAPPGADFPEVLVQGLRSRFANSPPEDMARVQLILNTRRMERRVRALFDQGPPCLLPRIHLLTDFGNLSGSLGVPPAISPMRKRFELVQLVAQLLDAQPDLAARSSLYDLADSLATLMDEMSGEGVSPDVIEGLDVSDQSGHWERAKTFFAIARHFLERIEDQPDAEARQRMIVEGLMHQWDQNPPRHPVIIAGSTGSRGTTMLLMQAVAKLPQGALVLPGFDFDMPETVWTTLSDALSSEDHPQFRFQKLLSNLDLSASDVVPWAGLDAPNTERNRLVSLALRPAPVTDQWLEEGPLLGNLKEATRQMTLVEAPSMREEALAIAMRLRQAAQEGVTAALITPDRMLTRQVTAALDRWDLVPDDSAGMPLQLSPPGRFLRHTAALLVKELTAEALLTLLKHPLCHSGQDRNLHLLHTRDLELAMRKQGMTYPEPDTLRAWAGAQKEPPLVWIEWVISQFCGQIIAGSPDFSAVLETHIALSERIAAGSDEGSGGLWDEAAGREAAKIIAQLRDNAKYAGPLEARDYADLFGSVIAGGEVRNRDKGHPNVLIWGTLEARVQGADLVILGGLNEGSWPEAPSPDPWLNRKMRHDAGLLLPERRIGLSAHDFQQAVGAPQVWLTRSIRSDEAETVSSRWVNRLTNLLKGLPDQGGVQALSDMQARGQEWLSMVKSLERVEEVPSENRPSPRPPVAVRPDHLSVTEIKKLIRDPYAIYARHILKLRPLDSLMKTPDALLRGIIVHEVLEQFVMDVDADASHLNSAHLLEISETVLAVNVPWATARALWKARIERVSGHFVSGEIARRANAIPIAYECKARSEIPELGFTLAAKADRIDRTEKGDLVIYDYKTGRPPSQDEQKFFDKQLLLEAAMAERGGFKDIDPADVVDAIYLGLGNPPKDERAPLADTTPAQIWDEFTQLIAHFMDAENGFTARRAMHSDRDHSDYDQLARFGEWDVTDKPKAEDLG